MEGLSNLRQPLIGRNSSKAHRRVWNGLSDAQTRDLIADLRHRCPGQSLPCKRDLDSIVVLPIWQVLMVDQETQASQLRCSPESNVDNVEDTEKQIAGQGHHP